MSKNLRIVIILLLFGVLIGLRAFASQLFYDPLDAFFKGEFQGQQLPEMIKGKLLLHTCLRSVTTGIISVLIINFWFNDRSKTQLTVFILAGTTNLFFILFWLIIGLDEPPLEVLFYLRRFLIQPLILILLIPAFYYEKRSAKRGASSN